MSVNASMRVYETVRAVSLLLRSFLGKSEIAKVH